MEIYSARSVGYGEDRSAPAVIEWTVAQGNLPASQMFAPG